MDSTHLCECGCGVPTNIAKASNKKRGHLKGQPVRFRPGHFAGKFTRPTFQYRLEDCGYETECWIWTRGKTIRGDYGIFTYGGKRWLAHRLSYFKHYGVLPDELDVCHHCDVPACIRPDHLFLGTAKDNLSDMRRKGRDNPAKGERVMRAVLTAGSVREIRRRYAAGGISMSALARDFGVKRACIHSVISKRTWKHLD